jgi:serine/threonine protein kinase
VEEGGYYPKPTDIWSIGVCIYAFISGTVPFYGDCELQIQINTRQNELKIPDYFSPVLNDLLTKMLSKDPKQRPSAYEVLTHPWFTSSFEQQFQQSLGDN